MSGKGIGLNQLLSYYQSVLPPNWLAHVSSKSDLDGVISQAERKGLSVASIEAVEQGISAADPYYAAGLDVAPDDEGTHEASANSDFRYSSRVVRWNDLHADGELGTKLSFGNYGSVWFNDEYRVVTENMEPGSTILAAFVPRVRMGGILVLPHILDMKSKRQHHLAQEGAEPNSPLFEVKGNRSVFHLQADVAARIGAQQCLYCLEMYKFIKGFAKHGIGMGEINAGFLFVDGTKSSERKYGTPPPQIQQFIGAALMLGVRVSQIRVVESSLRPTDGALAFEPKVPGLVFGERVLCDLTSDDRVDLRAQFEASMRFRDELQTLFSSRVIRNRIWTYHVPISIAAANGSPNSLAGRFRSLRSAARKYPKGADLGKWLISAHVRWQEDLPPLF